MIVEHADRKVLAFEIKLSRTIADNDVQALQWLKERIGKNLIDLCVIHAGPEAYGRKDGITVIPAALLGP